jgi:glycoprotein J
LPTYVGRGHCSVFVRVDLVPDAHPRRIPLLAALLALAALAVPASAPSADAKPCSDKVIDAIVADWYKDGRVDQVYALPCYKEAIRSLPVDVLVYSNAEEDILRALAYARQGKPDPGPAGGAIDPTPNDPTSPTDTTTGTDTTDTTDEESGVDTSGPSSIPIPLLILGGLALLLLAAGGAGYLSRRAQARRGGGPPDTA